MELRTAEEFLHRPIQPMALNRTGQHFKLTCWGEQWQTDLERLLRDFKARYDESLLYELRAIAESEG